MLVLQCQLQDTNIKGVVLSEADIAKVIQGLMWPLSGVTLALLVISLSGAGIYFRRYLEQKAQQLATREDFDSLQRQVAESTRLVKSIESELANNDWVRRELHSLRVRKIEELVTLALKCFDDMDAMRNAAIAGKHYGDPKHHERMEAIAIVYLPELVVEATAYKFALLRHFTQIAEAHIVAGTNSQVWDGFFERTNYAEVRAAFTALSSEAAKLLQTTSNGTIFQPASLT